MQTVSSDISLDAIGPKTKHWLYVSVVQNIELCTGIRAKGAAIRDTRNERAIRDAIARQ